MPIIPEFRRLNQEEHHEFSAGLGTYSDFQKTTKSPKETSFKCVKLGFLIKFCI